MSNVLKRRTSGRWQQPNAEASHGDADYCIKSAFIKARHARAGTPRQDNGRRGRSSTMVVPPWLHGIPPNPALLRPPIRSPEISFTRCFPWAVRELGRHVACVATISCPAAEWDRMSHMCSCGVSIAWHVERLSFSMILLYVAGCDSSLECGQNDLD